MKIKVAAALLTLAVVGAACASQPGAESKGQPNAQADASGRQCFHQSQVSGFAAQTDRIVNVRVGVRDVWQFELMSSCPDVRWNQRLGVQARGGSNFICSNLQVDIISPSTIGPQRCPVRSIRQLTPQEIEALPARARP